eukprot:COSAG05_NODE_45_length_25418_cov_92.923299_8_plen_62_part_00
MVQLYLVLVRYHTCVCEIESFIGPQILCLAFKEVKKDIRNTAAIIIIVSYALRLDTQGCTP